jgi:hypothetical protein
MRWSIETATEAWQRGLRALGAMPLVAAITFVLVALANAGSVLVGPAGVEEPAIGAQILDWAFTLLGTLALVPLAIAVHRYVLLGEVTQRYRMNVFEARFVRFAFYTIVIDVGLVGAVFFVSTIDNSGDDAGSGALALTVLLAVVLLLGVMLLWLLSWILFPAIAVDAPRPRWRDAVRDSAKHVWSLLLVVLVTGLPFLGLYFFLYEPLLTPSDADLSPLIKSVIEAALSVGASAVYAALASRLYLAFADRLARPPGLGGPIVRTLH